MRIPLLLQLSFPTDRSLRSLWLPWLLIYPILLALMLLILPFVLVAVAVLIPFGKAKPLILAGPYLWQLIVALGGLRIEVYANNHKVLLNFI